MGGKQLFKSSDNYVSKHQYCIITVETRHLEDNIIYK